MAPFILAHMPRHKIYIEPFGGVASVLLRKPKAYVEVYNDINRDVYSLFKSLLDDEARERLIAKLELTPFSRDLFDDAWERFAQDDEADPVERAWLFLTVTHMGFRTSGTKKGKRNPGWHMCPFGKGGKNNYSPPNAWATFPEHLRVIASRFRGVAIDNRDAFELFGIYDRPDNDVLFYVDPPYYDTVGYRESFTSIDHERLLDTIRELKAMCLISGYDNELYSSKLCDWTLYKRGTKNMANKGRTECLWLNAKAQERLTQEKAVSPTLMGAWNKEER